MVTATAELRRLELVGSRVEAEAFESDSFRVGRPRSVEAVEWGRQLVGLDRLIRNEDGLSGFEREHQMRAAFAGVSASEAFNADLVTELFGDVVERDMLDRLRGKVPVLNPMFRPRKVSHMGPDHAIKTKQAEGVAKRLQQIAKGGEYAVHTDKAKSWTYYVMKYGGRYDWFLEDLINDDLGYYERIPEELADSVNNTRSWKQTCCFWDANGPLDTFFNDSEVGQMGVSNLPLTEANLAVAIATMLGHGTGYRTIRGEPFVNIPGYLVVGPYLQVTAERILESAQVSWGGQTSNLPVGTKNVLQKYRLELIVDPWIPIVCTTGTISQTTWGLFSKTIKAGEQAALRGHEQAELFMRAANAVRAGGGVASPTDGYFADDSLAYKVRIFGGWSQLDPRAGWASDGQ